MSTPNRPITPAAKPVSYVKFSDKDVQSGLKTGDVNKIKRHAAELQNVTKALTAILPN